MAAPALRAPPLAPGSNGGTLTLSGGLGAPPGAVAGRGEAVPAAAALPETAGPDDDDEVAPADGGA